MREASGVFTRENPARTDETVFEFPWSEAQVELAVVAAKEAQRGWDRAGFEQRLAHVERLAAVFERRKEELALAICREAGKPLWEARGEAGALVAKIRIMSTAGMAYTQPVIRDAGATRAVYRPLGVLAVLGPFNFPLHLPNGHIIPALLNGNTLVVKPSEWTGGVMQLYFECIEEAGFPAGVINLVQGPGPVGAALSTHEKVDGVLFTGSYETGLRIKQATLTQHWKLLALEMGGKNTSIVLDDANLEQAAHELILASFLTTGQRCTATSRVVADERVLPELIERFEALAKKITTGDPEREEVFMGPIINRPAYDAFLQVQQDDEHGKLSPILAGGTAREDLEGYYLSPAIWRATEFDPLGSHQSREIFGPDVIFYGAKTDEQIARIANGTEYGLAMSVFTGDEERYERFADDLEAGIVNMNRTTAGASSALPFGGVKKSGNHRPAAVTAGLYCTYPQARLLQGAEFKDEILSSGPLALLK